MNRLEYRSNLRLRRRIRRSAGHNVEAMLIYHCKYESADGIVRVRLSNDHVVRTEPPLNSRAPMTGDVNITFSVNRCELRRQPGRAAVRICRPGESVSSTCVRRNSGDVPLFRSRLVDRGPERVRRR
jgi:hypothetical protein